MARGSRRGTVRDWALWGEWIWMGSMLDRVGQD